MLSICGVNCSTDCRAYQTECDGCNQVQGRVSWAAYYGSECCPIYDCARHKGLTSCQACGKAPCQIWYDTRNPSVSDTEFEADIASRLHNLRRGRD